MALKRRDEESSVEKKKKKRVGFAGIDSGIVANECIKIFLVSREEEVDATSSSSIDPVDINLFFGEEGKIYGYNGLKINVWVSSISFHAYADIMFESTSDGGKGITDLKPALQKIFGESLVEKKIFLQSFSTERQYIRNVVSDGAVICHNAVGGKDNYLDTGKHVDDADSTIEVIRMHLNSMPVGVLYSRLVPLVLLLVEGSRPVDITDPRWEIYFVVKKTPDQLGDVFLELLGFTTVYWFYHYPDTTRLRISQILVLPPYQGQGFGRLLLESVNSVAVSDNVYDVTVEEPSDYLQHLRACMDTFRLLTFESARAAAASLALYIKGANFSNRARKFRLDPPARVIENVRDKFKINKKQLLRCWEILVYLNLDTENDRCMEHFRGIVSDRVKDDILDKDAGKDEKQLMDVPNDYNHEMTFVVFRSPNTGNPNSLYGNGGLDETSREKQLNQLVDERVEEIAEIAKRVSMIQKP
uniref:histone acetyltransferase n=1 Tax=Anthurium amnicola TaxID=1678845 RepID=A0A1D1XQY7_9ARAE